MQIMHEFIPGLMRNMPRITHKLQISKNHEDLCMNTRLVKFDSQRGAAFNMLLLSDSASHKQQKEKFVKGMKKNKKGFEKDYGKDAESVMYATATKMAKEKK